MLAEHAPLVEMDTACSTSGAAMRAPLVENAPLVEHAPLVE